MKSWSLIFVLALAGCPRSGQAPPPSAPESEPAPSSPAPETTSTSTGAATPSAGGPGAKAAGQPCAGDGECAAGLHCTTADGDCDRPPGCAAGDICPTVCYGVCAEGRARPDRSNACESDADCAAVAHYCDGCHCLARNVDAPDPKCEGKTVACIANPCDEATVRCVEGGCRITRADPE